MVSFTHYQGLKDGEISTGTSILAVAYPGGVVLGADSRTSAGSFITNRTTDKLTRLTDHVFCCRSGSAADTQAIAAAAQAQLAQLEAASDRPPTVNAAAHVIRDLIYANRAQLTAALIVAGVDAQTGQPAVFDLGIGGSLLRQPYAIGGSGSAFVLGHCDRNYRPDFSRQQTIDFVRETLALAIGRDNSSGGCIRIGVITKAGIEREFTPGDLVPVWGPSNGVIPLDQYGPPGLRSTLDGSAPVSS